MDYRLGKVIGVLKPSFLMIQFTWWGIINFHWLKSQPLKTQTLRLFLCLKIGLNWQN